MSLFLGSRFDDSGLLDHGNSEDLSNALLWTKRKTWGNAMAVSFKKKKAITHINKNLNWIKRPLKNQALKGLVSNLKKLGI